MFLVLCTTIPLLRNGSINTFLRQQKMYDIRVVSDGIRRLVLASTILCGPFSVPEDRCWDSTSNNATSYSVHISFSSIRYIANKTASEAQTRRRMSTVILKYPLEFMYRNKVSEGCISFPILRMQKQKRCQIFCCFAFSDLTACKIHAKSPDSEMRKILIFIYPSVNLKGAVASERDKPKDLPTTAIPLQGCISEQWIVL
jgi:hypothetical protein